MAFGNIADMVATMPMGLKAILTKHELEVPPKEGAGMKVPQPTTSAEYIAALEKTARGRASRLVDDDRGSPANTLEAAGGRAGRVEHDPFWRC